MLNGELDYQTMERLPVDQEQIVLRAMHQTLVDSGFCRREHTEKGTLLIFPSYFKRDRPTSRGIHPCWSRTNSVASSMRSTPHSSFACSTHSRSKSLGSGASPRTSRRDRPASGVEADEARGSAGELEVYLDPAIPIDMQVLFMRYVHEHVHARPRT